jgi:hypothetical protein
MLLVVLTVASWQNRLDRWRLVASGLVLFTAFLAIGNGLITVPIINRILEIPVPRMRSMQFLPGQTELWRFIINKFHLEKPVIDVIFSVGVPVLFGVLCSVISLWIAWLLPRRIKGIAPEPSAGRRALISLFLAGTILFPTGLVGISYHLYDCDADILAADALAGKALQEAIPPQTLIFWRGIAPATLLHLPQAEIYPPQLNGDYSYRLGGDPDALLRYGWWDESLGKQWVSEADYALVAPKYYRGWLKDALESGAYEELSIYPEGSVTPACVGDVFPRVFRRAP